MQSKISKNSEVKSLCLTSLLLYKIYCKTLRKRERARESIVPLMQWGQLSDSDSSGTPNLHVMLSQTLTAWFLFRFHYTIHKGSEAFYVFMSAFKDICPVWQQNKERWWTHREGASSTVYTMLTVIGHWCIGKGIILSFMAYQSIIRPKLLHGMKQIF